MRANTPALFPTKVPRLDMLLSTVFKRTRKLVDLRALAARDEGEAAAVGFGALVEVGVVDEEVDVAALTAEAPAAAACVTVFAALFIAAEVEAAAASPACLSVLLAMLDAEADAMGIFLDLASPSRRPQRPPAVRPKRYVVPVP